MAQSKPEEPEPTPFGPSDGGLVVNQRRPSLSTISDSGLPPEQPDVIRATARGPVRNAPLDRLPLTRVAEGESCTDACCEEGPRRHLAWCAGMNLLRLELSAERVEAMDLN